MAISYLTPTWQQYHTNVRTIAEKILADKQTLDLIVAISRGGLTVGHLLTDLLRVPISVISIQSYTDIQSSGEVKILEGLHIPIEHKRVLLVDDVSDTGKTFERAVDYLKSFHPADVVTASVYYKPHSTYLPKYYAEQTDKWIIFPYEPTEMIMLIIKGMKKDGEIDSAIDAKLTSLGFTSEEIEFVRKYYIET